MLEARAKCDEQTRVKEDVTDATVRDLTTMLSDEDLMTRYATSDVDGGGGGRCDGFRP